MAAPISHKEISLTIRLYESLGFDSKTGKSSQSIARATYAWRRQYSERYGLAVKDLLDWNKNRNQFRSIAATFLMNDRNGETYWPSDDHSKSDVPEYPRDQALLVDVLSQIFWRQVMNEHQNRNRTRPFIDPPDSDVNSKTLPSSYDDQEQPELAHSPSSSLQNNKPDAPSVPKVPIFYENWGWPHSQVGLTRSSTLPAAVRPTEASQRNSHDVKPPKAHTEDTEGYRTAESLGTIPSNIVDFARNDGIGPPSSDNTTQQSSGLPEGNSTALPSIPIASDEQRDNIKTENHTDFDKYAGRFGFWKRERDLIGESQPRSSPAVTNAKRSSLSRGPGSPATTGPLPYGLADGPAGAGKVSVSEKNYGQTSITPVQCHDSANQGTTVSKAAEIHYSIITARKPRLCNVTWTRGGLSNRTWAGLLQEVGQYIEGAYVEGITFTLQMQDATYTTSVDRQDENLFIHMRNRWMRIIKEEMAEGISSEFEVELEPKYGARFGKLEPDEDFDITL